MSNRDFEVIEELELGRLNADQMQVWKRLVARRKRLDSEAELFYQSVMMDVQIENHASATGVRLRDDGTLVQSYCECFKCQARLQNLPPTFVVEAMVRKNLIPPERIDAARAWAASTDKQNGKQLQN